MKKLVLFTLGAVLGSLALGVSSAEAAIVAETNRSAWVSGVTLTGGENFNSFSNDAYFSGTFNVGSLTLIDNGGIPLIDVAPFEYNPVPGGIDGTPYLNAGALNSLIVRFSSAVSAVGFNWINYDINDDDFSIVIGGKTVFGPNTSRGDTGFVGFTDGTGAGFTELTILGSNPGGTFVAFDNFEFGQSGSQAVPTPALLPGLIGMGVAALRKKGQEEPAEQEA